MNEKPILFTGEMVKAILEGRKTQTRRLRGLEDVNEKPDAWTFKKLTALDWMTKKSFKGRFGSYFESEEIEPRTLSICPQAFPYGQVGDRLWVRETWAGDEWTGFAYRATDPDALPFGEEVSFTKWRPSIFMPRQASRINLEIISVRVERLNEITRDDVLAEGVRRSQEDGYWLAPLAGVPDYPWGNARLAYAALWNSINEKSGFGWDVNPWVWVIEFKRVES
jgi:hypothetical protein